MKLSRGKPTHPWWEDAASKTATLNRALWGFLPPQRILVMEEKTPHEVMQVSSWLLAYRFGDCQGARGKVIKL